MRELVLGMAQIAVRDIPAGTLVVVARGRTGEQVGLTATPCWGPGRWPFVLRWMGDRWTKRPARARVLRVASSDDLPSALVVDRGLS